MVAFLMGFVLICAACVGQMAAKATTDRIEAAAIFLPPVVLELLFLNWLKNGLEVGPRPFVPWFAVRQWSWPWPIRPLVAAWWLAHFGVAILGAMLLQQALLRSGDEARLWFRLAAAVVVSFTFAYSANLFLLLAVTCFTRSGSIVDAIWRKRFLLDAAVALAAGTVPLLHEPGVTHPPPDIRPRHRSVTPSTTQATDHRTAADARLALLIAISNFSPVAGIDSSSAVSTDK